MISRTLDDSLRPLKIEEVIDLLRHRWGVSYEMRLLVRGKAIFLQIMWGYLEQKSFPINEAEFKNSLEKVLEVLNRTGQASFVREWLITVNGRPKLGRALSLRLKVDDRLEEFVL